MNIKAIIDPVVENDKTLTKYFNHVLAVYKKTQGGLLDSALKVAIFLYVLDEINPLLKLLNAINTIEPCANKSIWGYVEDSLMLYARLCRERNENIKDIEKSQQLVLQGLEFGFDPGLNKKVLKRNLRGENLYTKEIEDAMKEQDIVFEANYRSIHLIKLIFIREMGASPEFPIEKVEQEIRENIDRLKEIIKINGLGEIIPFKKKPLSL